MEADPSLRVLGQFFAAATQHASVAMHQWTQGRVSLDLALVREAALEDATDHLDVDADVLTMVVIGVEGDCGGQLILSFEEQSGRRLAASLLKKEQIRTGPWSTLEKSAVMETGNILGSAYLSELSRLSARTLRPSAPYFVQDFGASVLQQALMMQAMVSDKVLICRTRFEFDQEQVNWNVFFVPNQELIDALHRAIGEVA